MIDFLKNLYRAFSKSWEVCDYPDVTGYKQNLRYCAETGEIEMLDCDGWCEPADDKYKKELIDFFKRVALKS